MESERELRQRRRWKRYWNRPPRTYDREMRLLDRVLFKDTRTWICSQATGEALEVGIGTGLNLPLYPPEVKITGVDFSASMIGEARRRARAMNRDVTFLEADAQSLPFPDASFDTVVATFALCAIPDPGRALREMKRVLRQHGVLLLADHVASSFAGFRLLQHAVELLSVPLQGEHFCRRPVLLAESLGLRVVERQRFAAGAVERAVLRQ